MKLHRFPDRRGFAMIVAIVLIALVSMCLTVLMVSIGAEFRRTQLTAEDAQLRQFILIAGPYAENRLNGNSVAEGQWVDLPLPKQFRDMDAKLRVQMHEIAQADSCQVIVSAQLSDRHAGQTLQFVKRDGKWVLDQAQLD